MSHRLTLLAISLGWTLVESHSHLHRHEHGSHIRGHQHHHHGRKAQIININDGSTGVQHEGLHDDTEFIGCGMDNKTLTEEEETNDMLRMGYYASKAATTRTRQIPSPGSVTIDVFFHLFIDRRSSGEVSRVTESMLEEELGIVNEDFGATPFRFRLAGVTKTYDNDWNRLDGEDDDAIDEASRAMREGGSDVMNVFVTDGLCDAGLGGFAQYPYEHGWYPEGTFSEKDRIFLCPIVLLGSSRTVTHEIGHWLGLRHTFEGNSCDDDNSGDHVADTGQHRHTGRDCDDDRKDTCPNQPGRDPIHNFMNYSACRYEFTPGQIERMVYQFHAYRRRIFDCDYDETLAEFIIQFDDNPEDFEIAYAEYIKKGNFELDRDWRTLKGNRDENNNEWNRGFRNKKYSREMCMPNGSMFGFHVMNEDENGFDDGGYMEIKVGGERLEFQRGDLNGVEWYSTFIIADRCNDDQSLFQLELEPNQDLGDLSWRLVRDNGGTLINDDDTEEFTEEAWRKIFHQKCVDKGESYSFTIYDSEENGIRGFYELKLDGKVIKRGGDFDDEERTRFEVEDNGSRRTPPPTRSASRKPTPAPVPEELAPPPTPPPTRRSTRNPTPSPTPVPTRPPTPAPTSDEESEEETEEESEESEEPEGEKFSISAWIAALESEDSDDGETNNAPPQGEKFSISAWIAALISQNGDD